MYRVLEKIKNKPFFKWPNKMAGNPARSTQAFIANTIKTRDTLQRNAGTYGTIWNSWSKKES